MTTQTITFLTMPLDIRLMIYDVVYPKATIKQPFDRDDPSTYLDLFGSFYEPKPDLLLTCKQTYSEALNHWQTRVPDYWANTTFFATFGVYDIMKKNMSCLQLFPGPDQKPFERIERVIIEITPSKGNFAPDCHTTVLARLVHRRGAGWQYTRTERPDHVDHTVTEGFRRYRHTIRREIDPEDGSESTYECSIKLSWDGHKDEASLIEACERIPSKLRLVEQLRWIIMIESNLIVKHDIWRTSHT